MLLTCGANDPNLLACPFFVRDLKPACVAPFLCNHASNACETHINRAHSASAHPQERQSAAKEQNGDARRCNTMYIKLLSCDGSYLPWVWGVLCRACYGRCQPCSHSAPVDCRRVAAGRSASFSTVRRSAAASSGCQAEMACRSWGSAAVGVRPLDQLRLACQRPSACQLSTHYGWGAQPASPPADRRMHRL